jgi:transcription antitermination factor NusG
MPSIAMLDAARSAELANLDPDPIPARCGRYWAVCHTHPQAERWAASNLTRRGFEVFLPLATVRRRDRVLPTLSHAVVVPMFPGYLFVLIDSHWTPVRYSPGVHRLLMDGDGKPNRLDASVVELLRAVQDLPADPEPWTPGTPCSLTTGPLRGHPGVVLSVSRQFAHVAVLLFGALRDVSAPVSWLTPRD